ncbi:homocitrate synthase/isopropylmalate synthase family protein [Anaerosacchariphilus polymeriproducens]|uniref:2-isopropylmalate synthase/homocitrate synthase post-catalytic domain-containing protein n=1 Tax=Anaerosacchariphilus polymeriproducens TaxID=1812858 RepID=A0A371AUA7_9FIRM|nr:hypothetical protein [Anaerosacchariphilus polymeriproducens]RDU23141.1 hypothetical protein DWV06_12340 [Anaerosacchariphilus polymeriproducens]
MIRIIDSTLAMLDKYVPTREQIQKFCIFMKEIGIIDLEISKQIYKEIKELPKGFRFYMRKDSFDKQIDYPGIYKYFANQRKNQEKDIKESQMNDIKEIVHLRLQKDTNQVRIVGLDDIFFHDYLYIFDEIKKIFHKDKIIFCPEDTYGCATGLAVEWLLNGGKEVTTTFAGCGCRAATEEVYIAMYIVKRYKPTQSLDVLVKIKKLFEEITNEKISDFKPILGEKIFQVESGIHVDGILKNPANYEAYPPEKVGQKTEIIIGKHSGCNSILMKCNYLGLKKPNDEKLNILLKQIKLRSVETRNSISDIEFKKIYKEVVENEAAN